MAETLIAVAIVVGFARRLTYTAAIVFSLLIWATAEGFGGPYTSGASDIGTAVIYALVFAALLAVAYYEGTSRFSVDYYLEQRISWWRWVAEVGRRNHPPARSRLHELAGRLSRQSPWPGTGSRKTRRAVSQ